MGTVGRGRRSRSGSGGRTHTQTTMQACARARQSGWRSNLVSSESLALAHMGERWGRGVGGVHKLTGELHKGHLPLSAATRAQRMSGQTSGHCFSFSLLALRHRASSLDKYSGGFAFAHPWRRHIVITKKNPESFLSWRGGPWNAPLHRRLPEYPDGPTGPGHSRPLYARAT